jgi:hypothetical protein
LTNPDLLTNSLAYDHTSVFDFIHCDQAKGNGTIFAWWDWNGMAYLEDLSRGRLTLDGFHFPTALPHLLSHSLMFVELPHLDASVLMPIRKGVGSHFAPLSQYSKHCMAVDLVFSPKEDRGFHIAVGRGV